MGWNGGGFGHMTFETPDGVAAWKAANVSHDQWTDWTDWFEKPVAPKFVVDKQLKELRKLHDPKGHGYFVLDEQGPKVEFAFDTGEDTVRDFSGTIAAALRASESHGARGTFYFLGTAGAEYDFTYKLEIANGHSTMEALNEHEIATIYEGDQYQAFIQRVMEALGITADGEFVEHAGTMPKQDEADDADAERAALKQKAAAFTAAQNDPPPKVTTNGATKATASNGATKATAATKSEASVPAKPAAKKAAAKPAAKAAAKPAAKKAAAKPAAKKAAAKPAAKKAAAKPAAKKAAAKKPAAKKPAAKKPAAKKPAAKKK